ncbi:hypothetical protein [Geminocystis sp. NIES-3708]|uniref:hypothetical protein n=1 Tax=Geminocystis sp. NIES-3708 TaxID=1615909 RepID=UPI00082B4D09|nr:hypothetical protein [Geminocystis sp. NIES-3708]
MYKRKQELVNLHSKVNQLYDIVKQLGEYIGWEGLNNISLCDLNVNTVSESCHITEEKQKKHFKTHKDILMDDDAISSELSDYTQIENNISCEEQVYRLTAQLTAAYHRIASLEDQLLATRSHMETRHNGFYHVQ